MNRNHISNVHRLPKFPVSATWEDEQKPFRQKCAWAEREACSPIWVVFFFFFLPRITSSTAVRTTSPDTVQAFKEQASPFHPWAQSGLSRKDMFQQRTLRRVPRCLGPPGVEMEPWPRSSTWTFENQLREKYKGNDLCMQERAGKKEHEMSRSRRQGERETGVNNIITTPSALAFWTGPKRLCRWLLWLPL